MTSRALVVGTGLIGTSLALALRHDGWQVWLEDANDTHRDLAVQLGAGTALPSEGGLPEVDVVVVAVPPSDAATVAIHYLRTTVNVTVMDVASTKTEVEHKIQSFGADLSRRFVPSHPMAGRELSGPAGARADLFADRAWVICPGADPEHVARAERVARSCGAFPVAMSAREHDLTVALTSHAVQVVSSAMAAALLRDQRALDVSGQGLRDVTRLAGSDPALWSAILHSNPGPVADVLGGIITDLVQVRDALSAMANAQAQSAQHSTGVEAAPATTATRPDESTVNGPGEVGAAIDGQEHGQPDPHHVLADFLLRGQQGRAAIPGRHGAGPERLSQVRVQVADEPGALAALFVAAGDLGINLLDVRIDHLWGRPSGLVELAVDPADAAALAEGLAAGGFALRD